MPVFEPIAKGSAEQPPRSFGSGRSSMRISALQANARTAVRSTRFAAYQDRCCHRRYASPPSHQRCFPRARPAERMKKSARLPFHQQSAHQTGHRSADHPHIACPHNAGWQKARSPMEQPSPMRSEEHTSELQSLMRISYAVYCLKKKKITKYKEIDNK